MGVRDTRQATTLGNRFRFVIRLLGLTGLLAVATGLVLAAADYPDPTEASHWSIETLKKAYQGDSGDYLEVASRVLLGGLAAVAVAAVIEGLGALFLITGRRSLSGSLATVGTLAAVVLLVAVNYYSFTHYRRWDRTRDQRFTLPTAVADDLKKLRPDSPTTIVVLQKHQLSGTLLEKRDSYVSAAERTVTEKVNDLVEQFRELGPRFNVVVLDVEAFEYQKRLDEATKNAPELKAAIESAPEDSIFFFANKRVQRLGFNEFLQLDKTGSREAEGGRGNLVLLPQGVERFARRVLAVQEKRPKVGVAVVHEWLTTEVSEGQEAYTLSGLKKVLTDYGFDVVDIVLKKNRGGRGREPAAYTLQESVLERLEAELAEAESQTNTAREDAVELDDIKAKMGIVGTKPPRVRIQFYNDLGLAAQLRGWPEVIAAIRKYGRKLTEATEPAFKDELIAGLESQKKRVLLAIDEADKEKRAAEERVKDVYKDERPIQDRKTTDIKVKLARLLSDIDLLIIPRLTIVNAPNEIAIRPNFHHLSKEQVLVIKDFMKSGKPVLACLGPLNDPGQTASLEPDDLETLLAERGVRLGRETILYDLELKAFSAMRAGNQLAGGGDLPPLVIADLPGETPAPPNPIGAAMRATGRSVDEKSGRSVDEKSDRSVDEKFGLHIRAPRPVYLARGLAGKLPFAGEFLLTPAETWNEEKPFQVVRETPDGGVSVQYTPRYEPTPSNDPKKETLAEERRGPFPVGVAIESKLPASWYYEKPTKGDKAGAADESKEKDKDKDPWFDKDPYVRDTAIAAALIPIDPGGILAATLGAAASRTDRPTGRLVVFGSGGLFTGPALKPANEKLLVYSVNWLTNRPDRLPQTPGESAKPWSFPRVGLTQRETFLWRWGTALGMPLLAVYLGVVAVMIRKSR